MHTRRLISSLAAVALAAALPATANAHVELVSSDPPPGASLDTAPTQVVITFDGELDPDGSSFTVTDAGGDAVGSGDVDLDVPDRNVLRGDVSIDADGVFAVDWTATASDGDVETGTFRFRVGEPGEGPAAPDTALAPPPSLLLAGLALVALAVVALARRAH